MDPTEIPAPLNEAEVRRTLDFLRTHLEADMRPINWTVETEEDRDDLYGRLYVMSQRLEQAMRLLVG